MLKTLKNQFTNIMTEAAKRSPKLSSQKKSKRKLITKKWFDYDCKTFKSSLKKLSNKKHQGRIQHFFRRGCTCLLLYFNTNKPHSFFCRIPVVLENRRSSQEGGGGVRTSCTLPLDPPLNTAILWIPNSEKNIMFKIKPLKNL